MCKLVELIRVIRVTRGHKVVELKMLQARQQRNISELYSGMTLLMYQLLAMVDKRFINSKRYKKGIIVQLLLPVIFSVLGECVTCNVNWNL